MPFKRNFVKCMIVNGFHRLIHLLFCYIFNRANIFSFTFFDFLPKIFVWFEDYELFIFFVKCMFITLNVVFTNDAMQRIIINISIFIFHFLPLTDREQTGYLNCAMNSNTWTRFIQRDQGFDPWVGTPFPNCLLTDIIQCAKKVTYQQINLIITLLYS